MSKKIEELIRKTEQAAIAADASMDRGDPSNAYAHYACAYSDAFADLRVAVETKELKEENEKLGTKIDEILVENGLMRTAVKKVYAAIKRMRNADDEADEATEALKGMVQ